MEAESSAAGRRPQRPGWFSWPLGAVELVALAGCTNALMPYIQALTGEGENGTGPEPTYTVSYQGNGSTGGSVPVDSGSYEEGETVTVLGNTGPLIRSGYSFAGWNTEAGGGGMSYAVSATFAMGTADVVLYAQWTLVGGSVAAWGYNPYGACNVPVPNEHFVAIAAGHYHSLGLKSDGSIVAWGYNDYGRVQRAGAERWLRGGRGGRELTAWA